MTRVLVTGATGFVGAHLMPRLITNGHDVHVITRPTSAPLSEHAAGRATAHVHQGGTEELIDILQAVKPEVVIHLASLFIARHASSDVEAIIRSNLLFSTQLMEAVATVGVARFINTGTFWQHYEGGATATSLYAATKNAFEAILDFYVAAHGLKAISLKLFDTYGPRDPRPKLLALLCRTAASEERLGMSPGEQVLDLIYIDDVIDAFVVAMDRTAALAPATHETYAVSSGERHSLREVVALFGRVWGKALNIEWGALPYRDREIMVPWDGVRLPGWAPCTALKDGIEKTIREFQSCSQ